MVETISQVRIAMASHGFSGKQLKAAAPRRCAPISKAYAPVTTARLTEAATFSTTAARQLERAMRPVSRLIPLRMDYLAAAEAYIDDERRFCSAVNDRNAYVALGRAQERLFFLQRIADHVDREFAPLLSERRLDASQAQQVALVRVARATSRTLAHRQFILTFERMATQPAPLVSSGQASLLGVARGQSQS